MLAFLLMMTPEELHDGIKKLYEEHNDELIKFTKAYLWQLGWRSYDQDAEDVVQRTYLKLLKYKKIDFTKDEKAVKSYVITTIQSVAKDFVKENDKIISIDEKYDLTELTEEDFYERLQIKERYNEVVNEIKKMELIYSTTLFLKMQEWTVSEIAEFMGVSEQTVYSRNRRGLRKLLNKIEGNMIYE